MSIKPSAGRGENRRHFSSSFCPARLRLWGPARHTSYHSSLQHYSRGVWHATMSHKCAGGVKAPYCDGIGAIMQLSDMGKTHLETQSWDIKTKKPQHFWQRGRVVWIELTLIRKPLSPKLLLMFSWKWHFLFCKDCSFRVINSSIYKEMGWGCMKGNRKWNA